MRHSLLACWGWTIVLCLMTVGRAGGEDANYQQDLEFLSAHTEVVELTDEHGARIVICPQLQGRVMTSTCSGPQGPSFGWINREFISAGYKSEQFNNYGGEDRLWLGPEGGQFAVFFRPGKPQELANWYVPPALNDGAMRLVSTSSDPYHRLTRTMKLLNASGHEYALDVQRTIRLLSRDRFGEYFGSEAAAALQKAASAKYIGFESDNKITNTGEPVTADRGLLSLWSIGMFKPGENAYVIIPYIAGEEAELGPVVNTAYFNEIPEERLQITPQAILFQGDGDYRSKIGVLPGRARPVAGAIDFDRNTLTLVHYTLPENAAQRKYVNNLWDLPQAEPYAGDAFNSYNDGPLEPGTASLGGFYELETLSEAKEMQRGESLSHAHRTFHIQGSLEDLRHIAQAALGVELNDVRAAFKQE